jgi:hypothetical protein
MNNKQRGYILILFLITLYFINSYPDYKKVLEVNQLFIPNVYSDQEDVKDIIKKTHSLPVKFQKILINNGIKINYVTWKINEIEEYQESWDFDLSGIFDGSKSRILLTYEGKTNHDLIGQHNLYINTFHEIGHAIDYDYLLNRSAFSYSSTPEFHAIFLEEAANLFKHIDIENYGDFYTTYRNEYFAESFAFYYASDETNDFLKKYAPKTYGYLKKISEPNEEYTFLKFIKGRFKASFVL